MITVRTVRVVSDGSPYNTHVYAAEGGEEIPVRSVITRFSVGDIPSIEIETIMPRIDITGEANIRAVCPYCGREES